MEEHVEFNPSYTLMTYALSPGESVNVEPGAMAVSYTHLTLPTILLV